MNLNLVLWIAAGLLAAVLLISAGVKMFVPRERIAAVGHAAEWVVDFSARARRAISALEIMTVAGLILGAVLAIVPTLVPVTVTGVALLFASVTLMRLQRG